MEKLEESDKKVNREKELWMGIKMREERRRKIKKQALINLRDIYIYIEEYNVIGSLCFVAIRMMVL